ncbi:MAG TPA: hypothetical protein VH394_16470 [Thermoanaerobaculia bacterium]|jgi:hypothetical protein|nr:hypothetical protein [Thermoanaerobaculia bacterium]
MRTSFLASLLLTGSLLPVAASADDVYLTNGRKFEGVIAETTDSQVRIRMQGGVISLPKSQVLRVDSKDSDLSGYLVRKEALRRNPDASARDWLELARWAKAQGLEQATREAALVAAELDPKIDGLAPILKSFRYSFDEQAGRWISYEESMRRRGFVFSGGVWVSREELAEREHQREQEIARRRADAEAARAERAARQTELLLATQTALLEETVRNRQQPQGPYLYTPSYGWPVMVVPGYFPPGQHCRHGDCGPSPSPGESHGNTPEPPSQPRPSSHGGFIRIPGSLIPGGSGGHQ